jgi:hypothetical protein
MTRLERVDDLCSDIYGPVLGDEGRSLTVDIEGEEDPGGQPMEVYDCVAAELGLSDSVMARIGATRALDGMQSAEWGGLLLSWTYHPDDGLWLLVEEA